LCAAGGTRGAGGGADSTGAGMGVGDVEGASEGGFDGRTVAAGEGEGFGATADRLVAGFGVLAGVGEGLAGLPSFSLSFPGARYPSERSASVVASSGVPAGRGTPASRAGGGAWCGPRPAIQRPSAT